MYVLYTAACVLAISTTCHSAHEAEYTTTLEVLCVNSVASALHVLIAKPKAKLCSAESGSGSYNLLKRLHFMARHHTMVDKHEEDLCDVNIILGPTNNK